MRVAASLTLVAALATVVVPAQSQDAATTTLLDKASKYAVAYFDAFSAIVTEEHQTQRIVRADGRIKQTRDLVSDFLLVKTGPNVFHVFRDVIEVDGKPVRDRADRVRKLFLDNPKTAVEQATAIARESERHNIGMGRTGNSPILPLYFLRPDIASGVRFTAVGNRLEYQEFRVPSVLSARAGGSRFALPSYGSFEIDPESGRVLAAEVTADGPVPIYSAFFSVRYTLDPKLDLMAPVELTERYWRADKPKEDHVEVASTYTNVRRFQVITGQQIK